VIQQNYLWKNEPTIIPFQGWPQIFEIKGVYNL